MPETTTQIVQRVQTTVDMLLNKPTSANLNPALDGWGGTPTPNPSVLAYRFSVGNADIPLSPLDTLLSQFRYGNFTGAAYGGGEYSPSIAYTSGNQLFGSTLLSAQDIARNLAAYQKEDRTLAPKDLFDAHARIHDFLYEKADYEAAQDALLLAQGKSTKTLAQIQATQTNAHREADLWFVSTQDQYPASTVYGVALDKLATIAFGIPVDLKYGPQNIANLSAAQLTADIGDALGSHLGRLIAGGKPFASVVAGTAGALVGRNLANYFATGSLGTSLLDAGPNGSPIIVDTFSHAFDGLGANLKGASLGALSALSTTLLGEAASKLHLGDFGTFALTKSGQDITQYITKSLGASPGLTGDLSVSKVLSDISFVNVTSYFANIAGDFLLNKFAGSFITSAKSIVHIDSSVEGYFATAGSIIGSVVGNAALPVLGGVIGDTVGFILGDVVFEALDFITGGFLSHLFGPSPPFGYTYYTFNTTTGLLQTDDFVEGKHLTTEIVKAVQALGDAGVGLINDIIKSTGAHVGIENFHQAYSNPHGAFLDHATFGFDKIGYNEGRRSLQVIVGNRHVDSTDGAFLVRVGAEYELAKMTFSGGDLAQVRAITGWQAIARTFADGDGLGVLTADLQTAKDYRNYLDNAEAINLLISMAPNSTFALGWTATLLRAAELGLDRSYASATDGAVGTHGADTIAAADADDLVLGNGGADVIVLYGGADIGAGGDGDDTIDGGRGPDILRGDAGNDRLLGGEGNDTANGGLGNDVIVETAGSNYLRGDDGNDAISGGTGFDDINGNQGNDTAHGGDADDWVVGGKDNDVLFGDNGGDLVYGNLGDDTLDGGAGNDTVRGGQDNDVLQGGAGNDFVSGDRGADTMSGGAGADIFHSFVGAGLDRVLDFRRAEGDYILLDHGATYSAAQLGGNTVVTLGPANAGDQIILVGVPLSSLTGNWIVVL